MAKNINGVMKPIILPGEIQKGNNPIIIKNIIKFLQNKTDDLEIDYDEFLNSLITSLEEKKDRNIIISSYFNINLELNPPESLSGNSYDIKSSLKIKLSGYLPTKDSNKSTSNDIYVIFNKDLDIDKLKKETIVVLDKEKVILLIEFMDLINTKLNEYLNNKKIRKNN